ncbi:unnamed protein product [Paramecium sonneborni]|uniref:Transmembrane protein n=1 Tax=Paramecium sonneborni TaxID=65129 RepID=A0A8S1PDK7_9CILI|nr:unnamed protein product [Paramecium sonneborni]
MIINQCDIQLNMNPLKQSLINKFHRKTCDNSKCVCSKMFIQEVSQANAITYQILKQFLRSKINNIMETKNILKNTQIGELVFIQTLMYYDYGWLTDCIKNLTRLLNCQDKNQNLIIKNLIQQVSNFDESFNETSTKKAQSDQQLAQYINVKVQLNMAQYCRLNFILHLAKFKLKSFLGTSMQAYQQLIVSDFIFSFLQYDKSLRDIHAKTQNLILDKIHFYNLTIKDDKQDFYQFAQQTKIICAKLDQLKKLIKQTYIQYPCKSIQRCLCFFQSELLNSYYEANKTSTLTSMTDDKIFKNKKIRNYEIQVEQTAYIILSIKGTLDDFNIEQVSSYFLQLIGYETFKDLQFNSLLPKFMRNSHPIVINNFFINGQSSFYKSFNQSFIQCKTGLLKTIFLSYDITKIIKNQNLVFAAFLQELPDQKCFILSHGGKGKLNFSENFFKKIGFDQKVILNLPLNIINNLSLQYILPDCQIDHSETETSQINTEMRFLMDKRLKELQNQGIDLIEYIMDLKQWEKEDQIYQYNVTVMITKRFIQEQSYFLIEISSITRLTKFSQDNSRLQTFQNIDYFSQRQRSPIPQERKNSISITSQINISIDAQPKRVKVIDIKTKEILKNNQSEDEVACNIASFRKEELQIHVPYQSQRLLLSDRKNDTQQEFFNIDQLMMDSNIQSSLEIQKSQINSKKKIDENDEIQSQQSSLGGLKDSQLFKKFEMIEKIIKSKKFSIIIIYIILLILLIMFWLSYTIIVVTAMSSQLLQFIQEIDMISLHASIMGPHDLYLSIKITITAYQQQNREKYIDSSTLLKLIDPLYQFNAPYYFDLQDSYFEILTNDHLTEFFIDQYETVIFMGQNETVTYSKILSFREELLAIINAQYQFKRLFDQRKYAPGQPFQVFQFANYFNLQDQLELLTDEILQFSKSRSLTSNIQWLIILIIYQIFSVLLGVVIILVKKRMLKTYENLLCLFYYSDKNSIEQEITKLKNLHQQISKNEETIQKYDFDFKEREEFNNRKKKENNQQKSEKSKLQRNKKLPQLISFLGIFLMYVYFLLFSVIIFYQTKNYLTKYRQTTDFYRLVQDMRFRSGTLYVYREILFRWSNFSYLTTHDQNRLYQLVEKSQNIIQQYLIIQNDQQNDQYLLSENYINYISKVQNENLCNFIDAKYINLTIYCQIALDGVLLKGMIPSLNYISTAIRNQQAINNFTKRVEVHFYELEGAQIISQVFSNVSQQLKSGMIELTQNFNHINKVKIKFKQILSYLFMASQLILSIIILSCFRKSLIDEFIIYKKSLYLIPIKVFLEDNSLERALRQFEFAENI